MAGDGTVLLAAGTPATRVRRLCSALHNSASPPNHILAAPRDEPETLPGDCVLAERGVLWAEQTAGTSRFLGWEAHSLRPRAGFLPITRGTWLETVEAGQVRVRELERAITAGGPAARDAARSKVELEAILSKLYKYKLRGDHADLPPELSTDYANILTLISGADAAPTANASPRMEELDLRFNDLMGRLKKLLAPIRAPGAAML